MITSRVLGGTLSIVYFVVYNITFLFYMIVFILWMDLSAWTAIMSCWAAFSIIRDPNQYNLLQTSRQSQLLLILPDMLIFPATKYIKTNIRHVIHLFWHDDVIKWRYFPSYWSFVRGIHCSLVNSPHKGQWRGALMPFLSSSEQTFE